MNWIKIWNLCFVGLVWMPVVNSNTGAAESTEKTRLIPGDTLARYFRLPEENGWEEVPDGFHAFDTTRLYDLIDGGAVIYNSYGMLHGIYQRRKHKDGRMYEALVMDFITPKKASALYREQKKQTGAHLALGTYDSTQVSASDVMSGICVYCHFGGLYFELTLTGYKEQAGAEKDALEFIKMYKGKSAALHRTD